MKQKKGMKTEKLYCIYCLGVIMEGEWKRMMEILKEDEYIQCPNCGEKYYNPYRGIEK